MSAIGASIAFSAASSRARRNILLLIGGIASAALVFIYYSNDPGTTFGFPPCLFNRLTTLFCPGCGSQRAAHALLHGHLLTAMHDNLLMCASIPLLLWEAIAKKSGRLPSLLRKPRAGWMVFFLVVAFWILRNVPLWPCTLLAPL